VRPGETLAMLAARYEMSEGALRNANGLKTDALKIGQDLRIPSTELAGEP
jgi:N-acetylmuramoyl-L-alanine amidase